ncbi:uncharacterized protein LOC141900655 isoform X2 [Tubulanus polymorphus]|uniref:uncharacterized protein LOC141900655 isoform X2 n=1 Tax=Tubulanus polymorphus TaxID=672921 RepID=UPI003DA3566B
MVLYIWIQVALLIFIQSRPVYAIKHGDSGFVLDGKRTDNAIILVGRLFSVNCTLDPKVFRNPNRVIYLKATTSASIQKQLESGNFTKRFDPWTFGIVNLKLTIPLKKLLFQCYYDGGKPKPDWIENFHLTTYPEVVLPRLEDLEITSSNWASMNVSWCKINQNNTYQFKNLGVQQVNWFPLEYYRRSAHRHSNNYSMIGEEFKVCPGKTGSCYCYFGVYGSTFHRNTEYVINITGNNFAPDSTNSTILTFVSSAELVKPKKVQELKTTEVGADFMNISFIHPKELEPALIRLKYEIIVTFVHPELYPNLNQSRTIVMVPDEVRGTDRIPPFSLRITRLQPAAEYLIGVRSLPYEKGKLWSETSTLMVTMNESIPLRGPVTTASSYRSYKCQQGSCRKVRIYYKKIPPQFANGAIIELKADYGFTDSDELSFTSSHCGIQGEHMFCEFESVELDQSYNVMISAETSVGYNKPPKKRDYFIIPKYNDPAAPDIPRGLVVEKKTESESLILIVSWKSLKTPPAYYIVFYCQEIVSGRECRDDILWKRVNGSLNTTQISIPHDEATLKTYIFAVASESMSALSKGMSDWIRCYYTYNVDIRDITTPNVVPSKEQEERSLRIEWVPLICPKTTFRVVYYILKWQEIQFYGQPLGAAETRYLEADVKFYEIKDLKHLKYYNVTLGVHTRAGDKYSIPLKLKTIKKEPLKTPIAGIIIPVIIIIIIIVIVVSCAIYRWWTNVAVVEIKLPPREAEEEELPSLSMNNDLGGGGAITASSPMIQIDKIMNQNNEDLDVFDDRHAMLPGITMKMENRSNYSRPGRQISGDSGTASLMSCSTQHSYLPDTPSAGDPRSEMDEQTPTSHNSSFNTWDKHDSSGAGYFRIGQTNSNNTATTYLSEPSAPSSVRPIKPPDTIAVHCVRMNNPYLPAMALAGGGLPKLLEISDEEEKKRQQKKKQEEENGIRETSFNGNNDLPAEYSKVTGIASSDEAICIDSENEGSENSLEQRKTSIGSLSLTIAAPPSDACMNQRYSKSHDRGLNGLKSSSRRFVSPYVKETDLAPPSVAPYVQVGTGGHVTPYVTSVNRDSSDSSSIDSDPVTPEVVDANPFNSSILPAVSVETTPSQPSDDDDDDRQVAALTDNNNAASWLPPTTTDSSNSNDSSKTLCNGTTSSDSHRGEVAAPVISESHCGEGAAPVTSPAVLKVNSSGYVSETHPNVINGHNTLGGNPAGNPPSLPSGNPTGNSPSLPSGNDDNMNKLQLPNCRSNKPAGVSGVNGYLPVNAVWQV